MLQVRAPVGLSDEGELRRALQALSGGKVRLLLKESPSKDKSSSSSSSSGKGEVCDGDVFLLDANFRHKLFRVKLSALQLKADPSAQAAVMESVGRDRA
jgi:cullin-4